METAILSKKQIDFLEAVKHIPFLVDHFYLRGGTALAAFYLHHRYSEDLDFFSEYEVDMLNLNAAIQEIKKELNVETVDFQGSFNRNIFFLSWGDEVLKTEFTYFPFPRIQKEEPKNGIAIDSFLDIAVNKLFTIYQRVHTRDYIDLYCMIRKEGFSMPDLIKNAKAKFDWHIDPLQLGTQFIKAAEVEDFPRMIQDVPVQEWRNFFVEEAKKLKSEIID